MNIFKKYGIREVADVTLYSITRIGDEEFYIPVLYFDTLKVSTLDKKVETVNQNGGKGNGKIISWNFSKDITLKLEDALFSQMSLNTFMNGRVMAKMSDWTSAIAKLNVANKYGQKNYSIKAKPSPVLTPAEQEIIFRCAQKVGYDPRSGDCDNGFGQRLDKNNGFRNRNDEIPHHESKYMYDEDVNNANALVAENRWKLMNQYYQRTQPTPKMRDISQFIDLNSDYESVCIIIKESDDELEEARRVNKLTIGESWSSERDVIVSFSDKNENYNMISMNGQSGGKAGNFFVIKLSFSFEKTVQGFKGKWAYLSADDINDGKNATTIDKLAEIINGYNKDNEQINGANGGFNPTFAIGDEFFLSHIPYFIFPRYLEEAISDLCWCDLRDKFYKAMPKKIIDTIAEEITNFSQMGCFENDLYEAKCIDRMERCVVNDRKGLKIDLVQQMINIKKMYNNDKDSYTVFYDAKTMLPFMGQKELNEKILKQKCVRAYHETGKFTDEEKLKAIKSYFKKQYSSEWVDSLTIKDIVINKITNPDSSSNLYLIYFNVIKHDYLNLKQGTFYYKWSRTIDKDENELTYIGTDISIDQDTFPGEYLIVGETYIREQQTGKDQRYQVVLNRTAISPSTSLKLQASGDPSTFSIDVNVLVPKIKGRSMIELRQYNVEEDKQEGGYRIVPQNKHHSYTPTIEIREQIIPNNDEIY